MISTPFLFLEVATVTKHFLVLKMRCRMSINSGRDNTSGTQIQITKWENENCKLNIKTHTLAGNYHYQHGIYSDILQICIGLMRGHAMTVLAMSQQRKEKTIECSSEFPSKTQGQGRKTADVTGKADLTSIPSQPFLIFEERMARGTGLAQRKPASMKFSEMEALRSFLPSRTQLTEVCVGVSVDNDVRASR